MDGLPDADWERTRGNGVCEPQPTQHLVGHGALKRPMLNWLFFSIGRENTACRGVRPASLIHHPSRRWWGEVQTRFPGTLLSFQGYCPRFRPVCQVPPDRPSQNNEYTPPNPFAQQTLRQFERRLFTFWGFPA